MSQSREVVAAVRRCQSVCQQLLPTSEHASSCLDVGVCSASSPPVVSTKGPPTPTLTMADFPYILQTHTRFTDCDMYGHVNNVMYYSYFDTRQTRETERRESNRWQWGMSDPLRLTVARLSAFSSFPPSLPPSLAPSRPVVNGFLISKCGMHPTTGAVVGLVVQSTCRYIVSVNFPSRMALGLRVVQLGTTSCTFEIAVFTPKGLLTSDGVGVYPQNATLCAVGKFVHVYCTRSNMRPTPIPAEFRTAMEKVASPELLVQLHQQQQAKQKQQQSSSQHAEVVPTHPSAVQQQELDAVACASAAPSSAAAAHQPASRILMVRPVHFRRNDETASDNAFMRRSPLTDGEIARRVHAEFDALVRLLTEIGVDVKVFTPAADPPAPDGVYPNNWISTHVLDDGGAGGPTTKCLVLHSMRHASRRVERDPMLVKELTSASSASPSPSSSSGAAASAAAYPVLIDLTSHERSGDIFEGTGSGVLDARRRVLYYCRSERSTARQATRFASAIWPRGDYTLVPFTGVDDHGRAYYHTNVVLALGTGWAVVCAEAIDPADRRAVLTTLERTGHAVLTITRDQANHFCGNILEVQSRTTAGSGGDRFLVMSTRAFQAFTEDQRRFLRRYVKDLVHTRLDTIEEIGGGGARCMMAELF